MFPPMSDVIPKPLLQLSTNIGIRAETDRRYKDFLSAWADYNRSLGQTRDWMLKGFESVGLQVERPLEERQDPLPLGHVALERVRLGSQDLAEVAHGGQHLPVQRAEVLLAQI